MAERRRDSLEDYRTKRHFDRTPEPKGSTRRADHRYLIQQHAARRLHYDFRLELDGVLKSWAVPKGPSLDPADKRLAVQTEDHPVDYATFEGRIPEGNYGAGTVLLWDQGTWEPDGDPHRGLEAGKLVFRLRGKRLQGAWALVRIGGTGRGKQNWLLIKERDDKAVRDGEVTARHRTSVASGRDMDTIAAAPRAEWHSDDGAARPAGKPIEKPRTGRGTRAAHAPLPDFTDPALATLVDHLPEGEGWLFEVKFDGYRALAAASGPQVRIDSRGGLDWTARYRGIARTLAGLDLPGVLLDGEMAVVDDQGRSDFAALQQALKEGGNGIAYFVFDLLAEGGRSLRDRPLAERKARLKNLLGQAGRTGPVFYADHVARDGGTMLKTLCEAGFEGVIAKRADAPYRSGRGPSWLKVKCAHRQEFVIVGWSPSTRGRPFSSLLLALNEDGALRYAGRVGTGFDADRLAALARRFRPAERPPVTGPVPPAIARTAHWVRPELVAEIGFAEFTGDGLVRQARFLGLRDDKEAGSVIRETPAPVEAPAGHVPLTLGSVHLSHPDKVLFPEQGITKRDLAVYLQTAAERMLPFVGGRLLTLLRCPSGSEGSCFVQRHAGRGVPAPLHELEVTEAAGKTRRYLYIEDADGLLAAAQMGVLELHIWGSRIDRVERPDRIVFDLDPDPTVTFDTVKQAARRMRDVLAALGLESFPLLTGGKGIHVVAPIQRRHDWPLVKAFTRAVAERMAADAPDRYVATMSKAKRTGRIFIDYLRNDHGATAVAPYSTRRHQGAPLAWPATWDALGGIEAANAVTIATAADRLRRPDPWACYHDLRQGLSAAALRALGL